MSDGIERGVQERAGESDAGYGYDDSELPVLLPSGIVVQDAGGLNSKVRVNVVTSSDAGQTVVTDAGQPTVADGGVVVAQGDAGAPVVQADAGSSDPYPTPSNPNCSTLFYRDLDADGFGDSKSVVTSCTQPSGYALKGGDCYDQNERAFPGAGGQFMVHRGDGSFDYDCDGVTTLAKPNFVSCASVTCQPGALGCDDEGGWTDFRQVPCTGASCPADTSKVPACGESGSWGVSVSYSALNQKFVCALPTSGNVRIQTCR